ncbi:helix-turn-helix domain-containing protein [Chryseobacterium sp. ERMR1:04]|uniref:winged helix-turn-helix transcriptional regulator n=1 Tax=Chryseobacterium sp. ERMR1:04 TaxID=1705393 RepID=UPI0006C8CF44|nr:helix-turn-helix domain-containing protein [Chryseobacterium sp. ERMR1:04]KPH14025.1 hypothetical protein AMQ68_00405 [Chryseobacterium sp. ERMR1:04]
MKDISQRSTCPVSFSLDFFGDKWTLLIVRDMILKGYTTFGDFQQSDEGIATNILTDRLKMLEKYGFIIKYPLAGKARTGYCLTEKGISLIPVVIELALWGSHFDSTEDTLNISPKIESGKEAYINQLKKELTAYLESKKLL